MVHGSVLVVEDDRAMSFFLTELMKKEGYRVLCAFDGPEAQKKIDADPPDVVLLDVRLPGFDGLEVLRRAKESGSKSQFIVITAFDSREIGVRAIQSGAYDYFPKPLDKEEVRIIVRRALRHKALEEENLRLRCEGERRIRYGKLIGQSRSMQQLYEQIDMILETNVTVLIVGESGTGKELVAQAIHYLGPRKENSFVTLNCVAIPDSLLESELFGHEKGSFTGAMERKIGKFERANGGTVLLDEIGDMGLMTQAKVLRFIQERTLERLGGIESIPVDVRLIAATNKDLGECVKRGEFREDLFYRLNVIRLHLPPLRERTEDIPLLVEHFVEYYSRVFRKAVQGVSQSTLERLLRYPWPGNVRELENLIQRGVVMCREDVLTPECIPMTDLSEREAQLDDFPTIEPGVDLPTQVERITERVERNLILSALRQSSGRRQKAADLLGISRKTLHNKMVKHGLFHEG